jgi:DNA-directed RNA polymerase specialized sigma subunit
MSEGRRLAASMPTYLSTIEVGKILGVSKMTVSNIENLALFKISKAFRAT